MRGKLIEGPMVHISSSVQYGTACEQETYISVITEPRINVNFVDFDAIGDKHSIIWESICCGGDENLRKNVLSQETYKLERTSEILKYA